jgi:Sap, sulfolipid-1-addressing protein
VPVSIEVIILGLFSGLRPGTSTVAVLALLKSREPARRLLLFTVTGLVFAWMIGVIVVLVFHGVNVEVGGSTPSDVLDIVLGAALIGFAAGMHRGWLKPTLRRSPSARSTGTAARLTGRLRNPTAGGSAAAGALTHLPGIVYLLALNAIATQKPPVVDVGLYVALYTALWFLVPLASLILVMARPRAALRYLETATAWAQHHEHAIVVVGLLAIGSYAVVKGTVRVLT